MNNLINKVDTKNFANRKGHTLERYRNCNKANLYCDEPVADLSDIEINALCLLSNIKIHFFISLHFVLPPFNF